MGEFGGDEDDDEDEFAAEMEVEEAEEFGFVGLSIAAAIAVAFPGITAVSAWQCWWGRSIDRAPCRTEEEVPPGHCSSDQVGREGQDEDREVGTQCGPAPRYLA